MAQKTEVNGNSAPTKSQTEVQARPEFRTINWRGNCPHCGEAINFRLKTDFGAFDVDAPDADWLASLSKMDRDVLALAQSTGVLESFDRTLRECRSTPFSNPSKSFLKFLGKMKPLLTPGQAGLMLSSEFPHCRAAVYGCGDVSAIALDGDLRLFVPTSHLFPKKPQPTPANVATVENGALKVKVKEITANANVFRDWVKTRMGYVPREGGVFLREMRKRCYGAFGASEPRGGSSTGAAGGGQ